MGGERGFDERVEGAEVVRHQRVANPCFAGYVLQADGVGAAAREQSERGVEDDAPGLFGRAP